MRAAARGLALVFCAVFALSASSAQSVAEQHWTEHHWTERGGFGVEGAIGLHWRVDDGDHDLNPHLDFSLFSVTRTEQLRLDFDEDGRFSPTVALRYQRRSAATRLELEAFRQTRDLGRLDLTRLTAEFDEADYTDPNGVEEQRSVRAALGLGVDRPIGFRISYQLVQTRDREIPVALRDDRDTHLLTLQGRGFANPTLELTASTSYELTLRHSGDQPDQTMRRASVGAIWQARPTLEVTGELGYAGDHRDGSAINDLLEFRLQADLTRPRGAYRFSFERQLTDHGAVGTLTLARSWPLSEVLDMQARLGVTDLPESGAHWIGALHLTRQMPSGLLEAGIDVDAVQSDEDEIVRTIAFGRYSASWSDRLDWSVEARFTQSEFQNELDADLSTFSIGVRAHHLLTPDWGLSSGVLWEHVSQDGLPDSSRESVFIRLERRFSLRR